MLDLKTTIQTEDCEQLARFELGLELPKDIKKVTNFIGTRYIVSHLEFKSWRTALQLSKEYKNLRNKIWR